MRRVLVTGGTGGLGRYVVDTLARAGYGVRVMSRRPRSSDQEAAVEWAQADLASGAGLPEALDGVDTIVHAATGSPFNGGKLADTWRGTIDVGGTQRLLDHARAAGVAHVVYISIVGIDRVPFRYYRHKLRAEALVQAAGVPWSILRATQFHSLIGGMIRSAMRLPVALLPSDLLFQPVHTKEAADRLVGAVDAGPSGRLPDLGGPEALTLGDMARTWMAGQGLRRRVVYLPLPGPFAAAVRGGGLLCPHGQHGTISWAEWVRETASAVTSFEF